MKQQNMIAQKDAVHGNKDEFLHKMKRKWKVIIDIRK